MSSFFQNFVPGRSSSSSSATIPAFVKGDQLTGETQYPGKILSINQSYPTNFSSSRNHSNRIVNLRGESFLDTYDLFCSYPSQAPVSCSAQFASIDWPFVEGSGDKRRMGNGMDKVLSGLYVGSVRDSKDVEQLRANNITHIISIHDNPKKGLQEVRCIVP